MSLAFKFASRSRPSSAVAANRLVLALNSKSFSVACTRRSSPLSNAVASANVCAESDPIDKVDLRVGIVEMAKKHEQADSLYVLSVNIGERSGNGDLVNRTIVSGLVEYYSEHQLEGKKVVVLANMKARKLRGVVSQGMLLAAKGAAVNGNVIVQVLEAGRSAQAGDPVRLQGNEKPLDSLSLEKSPIKRQRVIEAFIEGLSLDSCIASYRGQRLVAGNGNDHVATHNLPNGVIA
ncbi:hypothetical protein LPJ64_002171 [Coemansia asiatica]|uniref:tRNA-binding domain-containing protein n=1 Tax=Coemansia asiatica TaxID=1052880 RepID=A0A9W7XMM3_9FUNG|nr:hypothetical protein LPJ64_002171 [Coemansia asiatica]KAJ2880911.1 hypothetical protein FB639_002726 [Coemansia asiatica]